ncbi:type II secretory ATPase GspE/PulE/Tfp pilus assembly ATPase PilB-like protein [Caldalkalibacillus uzonensis]|uniref:Type II secretory ATPase GspE/PulE/Tfp pilus assembly ATPase PilB-like protein n=2 Tax=Caldalkalibacillus uzonensis TaxID=353224 RepID=A0ABU0CMP7_9BACI|nr:type II secretory ATPase GspE/PulE/Tfp pilus assembly ATPase PilB-like protein [Caldalkalibacillus uzonensis]
MLDMAIRRRASDIHLQPQENQAQIKFRIDGRLIFWQNITLEQLKAMVTRLKFIADMDIGETRVPQDGALYHTFNQDRLQLRLSTMPTIYGEKLVIRIFPLQQERLALAHLGFTPQQYEHLKRLIQLPHGLFLITGPTGSGKTTTLYKILEVLAEQKDKNICSLEDPVEMRIPGLTQVQVNPHYGLTFAKGLRAMLRQDPDVIFVGEIRDEETAEIAVRAALTGHLVLSTLHTYDTVGAIVRLLEMGIKPYYVASALIGVISQRLFRLRCLTCYGQGCYQCFYTGYYGRRGVFEMLPILKEIRIVIHQGGEEERLRQAAAQLKIASLGQQLIRYQAIDLTTTEECWGSLLADQHFHGTFQV